MAAPRLSRQTFEELQDVLSASREKVFNTVTRGGAVFALLALIANGFVTLPAGQTSLFALYIMLYAILLVVTLGRQMPFWFRGGTLLALVYALAVADVLNSGIASGNGRTALLAFAVLATVLFGAGTGIRAALLSVASWLMVGAMFTYGGVQPPAPRSSAVFLDWVEGAANLLLFLVALSLPYREFLEVQVLATVTTFQKKELQDAQASLELQTRALAQTTEELAAANLRQQEQAQALERRISQLAVSAGVARVAASLHDLPELLQTTVTLISERFGFYHAGIFLVDDRREWAVLEAANSPGGQRMLARSHRLRVGQQGIVGYVTQTGRPRIALDVGADAVHFLNTDLPDTHSEMAVPLTAHGEVIGALDVQSEEINIFTPEDVEVLQTLADQLAVAIDNARLFEETQRRLEEMRALQLQGVSMAPSPPGGSATLLGYRYDGVAISPLTPGPTSTSANGGEGAGRMQIPINVGNNTLGSLELTRADENWSPDDVELTRAIADRMALALENARLFETTRATLAETARLYKAARAIAGAQSLNDILRAILTNAVESYLARFVIGLIELGSDRTVSEMEVAATWDSEAGTTYQTGQRYTAKEFPFLQQIDPSFPVLIESLDVPDLDERSRSIFLEQNVQSVVAIPVVVGGSLIGVFLAETREPHPFTPEEVRPLRALADQAATAIENIRLLEETQRRISELATLNSISQVLTAELEPGALLSQVGDKIVQTFGAPIGNIALYNRETNLIEFLYSVENGQRVPVVRLPLGEGVSSVVIRTRQPVLINQDAERRLAELGATYVGEPAKSYLGVPILVGDQAVGLISLQSTEQAGLFDETALRLLSTIAANVGVALQNARLFEETQRRVAELATLNTISQIVTSQRELNVMFYQVGKKILETFHAQDGFIALYDRRTDLIEVPFYVERGEAASAGPFPVGQGLSSVIIRTRQPLLINQDAERRTQELGAIIIGEPARSFLGVPIVAGDDVIGVISLQDTEVEGLFSEADARLLTTIAATVGGAIQGARLFDETQRRAQQLAVAAEVSRVSISALDPNALMVQVVELIRERFDLYYAALFLVDESGQWAMLRHATGEAGRELLRRGHRLEVGGQSMIGAAVKMRQARIALDVGKEAVRFVNPLLPETRSEMAIPLGVGARVLGALSVQSTRAGAFSDADVSVLQTMADQIAIALQNAQLLSDIRSTQVFLDSVIENLPIMVSVKDARELRWVRWNKAGEEIAGFARDEMIGKSDHDFFSQEEADFFIQKDREVLAGRQLVDIPEELIQTRDKGLRYLHTRKIPILGPDGQPQYLLGISEDITELKASQEALQRRAQQLATAADVSRASISVLNPDDLIVQAVELIRERFDLYYAALFLVDETGLWATLRHATGEAGRELLRRGHHLEVGGQSMIGTAMATRQARIALDAGKEAVRFANPLLPETRSEMAIPLAVGDTVLGALSVQSTRPNAFSDADVTVLQTMADQIAIALQNARLFKDVQQERENLSLLYDVLRALSGSLEMTTTINTALRFAPRLGAEHGYILLLGETDEETLFRSTIPGLDHFDAMQAREFALTISKTGLERWVLDHRRPAVVADVREDARWYTAPAEQQLVRSVISVPLAQRGLTGVLAYTHSAPGAITEAQIPLVESIAAQVAVALENARLFEERTQQEFHASSLARAAQAMSRILKESELMEIVAEELFATFRPQGITLFRWDSGEEALTPVVVRLDPEEPAGAWPVVEQSLPGSARSDLLITIQSRQGALRPVRDESEFEIRESMTMPLVFGDQVEVVIEIIHVGRRPGLGQAELVLFRDIVNAAAGALQTIRLYELQRQTAEHLAEVDRLKSQFLANMSHELRTPLNSIIGFSRVILKGIDGPITDLQNQDLTSIYHAGQHLLGLINDVLDMSRIEAGKMELVFDEVDLRDILKGVLSTTTALIKDKPVVLRDEIASDLPMVRADSMRVRQVLLNLLANGAKFTERGSITLSARAVEALNSRTETVEPFVEISVKDTGNGIAPADMVKLFEPFSQVDASATRKAGGTGLGLSICRNLVELHGGRIWAESEGLPDEGSTFTFTLPVFRPEPQLLPEPPEALEGAPAILVVDDDQGILRLYRRYLEPQGYRVMGVHKSAEVIASAAELQPAAILLDVLMPNQDGWKVLTELKQDAATRDIPVIMCTISTDQARAVDMGAAEYLVKPILESDLLRVFEKLRINGRTQPKPERALAASRP